MAMAIAVSNNSKEDKIHKEKNSDFCNKCRLTDFQEKGGIIFGPFTIVYHKTNKDYFYADRKISIWSNENLQKDSDKFENENNLDWFFHSREIDCLKTLSHDDNSNFVRIFHVFKEVDPKKSKIIHFIMEYCEGGDLKQIILENRENKAKFNEIEQV